MVRKLDKIEKEMGYCEIKLEKERRLRRQIEYLRADYEVLDRFYSMSRSRASSITSLPFERMGLQITAERQVSSEPGPRYEQSREQFITAGLLELVGDERELMRREIQDVEARFDSFVGFDKKKLNLQEEKELALDGVSPLRSPIVRKLNAEFKSIEHIWNSLTEDAIHLDEALFYLSRNLDYLKSCRSFLVAAKGSFDIESWIEESYHGSLFRHSNIGRSKEMIDGANRNLKLAQKELVCVSGVLLDIQSFEPLLVRFLGALFDDIFLDGRVDRTITVVESAIEESDERLQLAKSRREELHKTLEKTEGQRGLLFQQMGGERRGRSSAYEPTI